MVEPTAQPWVHLGDCPFCGDGLVRLRTCTGVDQQPHCYALCDECETIWLVPDTQAERHFPDAENPQCPICLADLYGPQARWAVPNDLTGSDWESKAAVQMPQCAPSEETPASPELTSDGEGSASEAAGDDATDE